MIVIKRVYPNAYSIEDKVFSLLKPIQWDQFIKRIHHDLIQVHSLKHSEIDWENAIYATSASFYIIFLC